MKGIYKYFYRSFAQQKPGTLGEFLQNFENN